MPRSGTGQMTRLTGGRGGDPTHSPLPAPPPADSNPPTSTRMLQQPHRLQRLRETPVCPPGPLPTPPHHRVTCRLVSPLNLLRGCLGSLLHLPLPSAAAALLLHVVVGSTHAPGIGITALARISWTTSVFIQKKRGKKERSSNRSMAVQRIRRMRCVCAWIFPLLVTAVSAQR